MLVFSCAVVLCSSVVRCIACPWIVAMYFCVAMYFVFKNEQLSISCCSSPVLEACRHREIREPSGCMPVWMMWGEAVFLHWA